VPGAHTELCALYVEVCQVFKRVNIQTCKYWTACAFDCVSTSRQNFALQIKRERECTFESLRKRRSTKEEVRSCQEGFVNCEKRHRRRELQDRVSVHMLLRGKSLQLTHVRYFFVRKESPRGEKV